MNKKQKSDIKDFMKQCNFLKKKKEKNKKASQDKKRQEKWRQEHNGKKNTFNLI